MLGLESDRSGRTTITSGVGDITTSRPPMTAAMNHRDPRTNHAESTDDRKKLQTMKLHGMADAFREQIEMADSSQLSFEERFG